MGMAAVKILILLPNIYYKEINWLFTCLVINSGLSYWLSFTFHIRSCVALQRPLSSVRKFKAWLGLRAFLLLFIYFASPLFILKASKESAHWETKRLDHYPFLMDCTALVYPNRFLGIFMLDIVSATVDPFENLGNFHNPARRGVSQLT